LEKKMTNSKNQISSKFQCQNTQIPNEIQILIWKSGHFNLRKNVRTFVKKLPITVGNSEDGKQRVRSSGSIGVNYIEANEALSKKDFLMQMRISGGEAKEGVYWLRLSQETNHFDKERLLDGLIQEAIELKKILSAIIEKSK